MFGIFKREKKQKPKVVTKKSEKKSEASEAELLKTISGLQRELDRLKISLVQSGGSLPVPDEKSLALDNAFQEVKNRGTAIIKNESESVIEGVFDGEAMIGSDGQRYDVPANYASKSKLVEGDILKLTINNLGAFLYKQIKPIGRLRQVGVLEQDEHSLFYYAVLGGKRWRLLTASVTYYKGEPGDQVIFLVPEDGGSRSAAVDSIIKN